MFDFSTGNKTSYLHEKNTLGKLACTMAEQLQNAYEHKGHIGDPTLEARFATSVAHEAMLRLGRDCKSEDDEEYFAMETTIVKEVLQLMVSTFTSYDYLARR